MTTLSATDDHSPYGWVTRQVAEMRAAEQGQTTEVIERARAIYRENALDYKQAITQAYRETLSPTSNCLYCKHPVTAHPRTYVADASIQGCSECGCRMTAVGARTPPDPTNECTRDYACYSADHHYPNRVGNPNPGVHSIIENHRAVCTATADQISDLERQVTALIDDAYDRGKVDGWSG